MEELADKFFEVITAEDGSRTAPSAWRAFDEDAERLYGASPEDALEELATLALYFETSGEPAVTAYLRRLGNQLNGRFQGLWDIAHAHRAEEQDANRRASRTFLGNTRGAPAPENSGGVRMLDLRIGLSNR